MTLAAMLAPTAVSLRMAAHLAVDAHHHEEPSTTHDDLHDAAIVLHGHGHENGTAEHSHDTTLSLASSQASIPSLTVHPSVTVFVSSAFTADAAVLDRFDPSPPLRVPIILRI